MTDYKFSKGQEVVITKRDDLQYGYRATVCGFSYYPGTIVYELEVITGYRRWLWRRIPVIEHRGMVGAFLIARTI